MSGGGPEAGGHRPGALQAVPNVVIVGTPRSGTTLVQRLLATSGGLATGPESQFLDRFLPRLLARRSFPLTGPALGVEVRRYLALPTSRNIGVGPEAVIEHLGGRALTPADLFAAVTAAVAHWTGPPVLVAEKTPEHLRWWRPLARARPELRLIGVVRDPRGVAASHAAVPWGIVPPLLAAEQWSIDVAQLLAAERALGPDRVLVVRYEDVVADPDEAGARLGRFVAPAAEGVVPDQSGLVLAWEWWKHGATGPVSSARAEAWIDVLEPGAAADVAARCHHAMNLLGYVSGFDDDGARARAARWPQALEDRRRRYAREKARRQRVIDTTPLA